MQTILTQCPRCQTSFKVSDKQLAIAAGMVRCGSCLDVFFAPDNRITIKQPVSAAPPPEDFPDDLQNNGNGERDEDWNGGTGQGQARPLSAPSYLKNVNPHHPQISSPAESDTFQPGYEAGGNQDAWPAAERGPTRPSTSEASSSSDDDFEFILDYEDDVQLGDMMLEDVAQDELLADGFDVAIHDAGNAADSNPGGTNSSATTPHKETADSDAHKIEYVHEPAYQPEEVIAEPQFHSTEPRGFAGCEDTRVSEVNAGSGVEAEFPKVAVSPLQEIVSEIQEPAKSLQYSEPSAYVYEDTEQNIAFNAVKPDPELIEPALPIQADSLRTDYYDEGYSSHQDQPASPYVSGARSFGFDIIAAAQPETTNSTESAFADPQELAETHAENIQAEATTAKPDNFFPSELPADDDDQEQRDPEDSFSAVDAESAEFHTLGFSAISPDDLEEIELTAATSTSAHPQRGKEELRQYLTELQDADALGPLPTTTLDSIEADPLTFEVSQVFRKYVTTFGWLILSTGLVAALILQVVASNLEFMQRSPSYARYLPVFCKVLDCPEPQRVTAIQSFNSQDLLVRSHPGIADALQVSFIFRNDADMPQPFPLVELSFMDTSRRLMANRLFKPEEYLPSELAALDEMPASSSVQVMLEMTDPGSDAVNYEIGFRDPATEIAE